MLINFSNHPSKYWEEKQIWEASAWGEIVDIPFPSVPASANEQEVELIADQYTKLILEKNPSAVLYAGVALGRVGYTLHPPNRDRDLGGGGETACGNFSFTRTVGLSLAVRTIRSAGSIKQYILLR